MPHRWEAAPFGAVTFQNRPFALAMPADVVSIAASPGGSSASPWIFGQVDRAGFPGCPVLGRSNCRSHQEDREQDGESKHERQKGRLMPAGRPMLSVSFLISS